MNLPNKPRILAATYNLVSNTKMTSFLVDFPTVLLAELRTHRILTQGSLYEHSELVDFNLSANSARAISHNKYLEKVLDNPFIPIWTKQQKGMSGELLNDVNLDRQWIKFLNGFDSSEYEDFDTDILEEGVKHFYNNLINNGVHKQNANRLLAPFAYTTCIISGTKWDNFFDLRCPKYEFGGIVAKSKKELYRKFTEAETYLTNSQELNSEEFWNSINTSGAQPEFQVIAEMLYDLYQEADWKESKYHIPFEEEIWNIYGVELRNKHRLNLISVESDLYDKTLEIILKEMMLISASMCAKLSYNTQDNEDTLEKHLERANMLMEHKHWEPFSHQAIAMTEEEYENMFIQKCSVVAGEKLYHREYGVAYNLRGFTSQRYILENY